MNFAMIAFNATLLVAILWLLTSRFAYLRPNSFQHFWRCKKNLIFDCGTQGKSIKQFNAHLPILTHFGPLMRNSILFLRNYMDNFNAWKIWHGFGRNLNLGIFSCCLTMFQLVDFWCIYIKWRSLFFTIPSCAKVG